MDTPKNIVGVVRGRGQRAQAKAIRDWCQGASFPVPTILMDPEDEQIVKQVKHRGLLVVADTKILGDGLHRPLRVTDALEKKKAHVVGIQDMVDTRTAMGWFAFVQGLIHAQFRIDLVAEKARA